MRPSNVPPARIRNRRGCVFEVVPVGGLGGGEAVADEGYDGAADRVEGLLAFDVAAWVEGVSAVWGGCG